MTSNSDSFSYTAIGRLKTPFCEPFGVPRQSLLVPAARGVLKLNPHPEFAAAMRGLETFSHIWLLFAFHKAKGWHPLIETPRVASPKMGVFATRSPHRPNSIGMSVVKLDEIKLDAPGGIEIYVSGVDILDDTPILDIKPYVSYVDCLPSANSGWLVQNIEHYEVEFSPEALAAVEMHTVSYPDLKSLLIQMLELDPRPLSQRRANPLQDPKSQGLRFAFRVLDLDVHWIVQDNRPFVTQILKSHSLDTTG